jgi:thiamine-phosphate pyrophosphorylase
MGWSFERFVKRAYKLDARVIQYRDKVNPLTKKRENLKLLRSLWDRVLLINDETILVDECDGVHLGQEDLDAIDNDHKNAIKKLREESGKKIIGISTHNREEILEANTLGVDYIGLGAYRATSTKTDVTDILGERIDELARYSTVDVAAIGGVKKSDRFENITYLVIGSDFYED